ncbi:MAG: hypothetical protein H7Y33_02165 [Cytophagales bacterium]|nr:hypothetical protein [Rhizobacter sp.]
MLIVNLASIHQVNIGNTSRCRLRCVKPRSIVAKDPLNAWRGSSRNHLGSALAETDDLGRSVLGPNYSGEALRGALQAGIGDKRPADTLNPVVVHAADVGLCRTKVFKTPHAPTSQGNGRWCAPDSAMAACVAPSLLSVGAHWPPHLRG